MFQSDELIYIQMQKSASSHIASLLPHFFDGQQMGKHNSASTEQIASHPYFVSSIRNPWDWYLSLWTFGVKGVGGFRSRLIKGPSLRRILKNPSISHYLELKRRAALFRKLYEDNKNVESFRTWLKLIHHPETNYLFKEGHQAISSVCGPMTFRYLNLCCQNMQDIISLQAISNFNDLVQFDKDNCYIEFFIRQESLEDDFCKAIEKVRAMTQQEKDMVYGAKKTNTSKRSLTISDYYNDECIDLVEKRDQFLIEKFGYSFPSA